VQVASIDPNVTVPASVTVPAGSSTGPFTATVRAVASDVAARITATFAGVSQSTTLNLIAPPALVSLACTPDTLTGNTSAACTVGLNRPAPTGGTAVPLTSSNPLFTVPASVLVAAGTSSGQFAATVAAPQTSVSATLTATLNGASRTFLLSASPAMLQPAAYWSLDTANMKAGFALDQAGNHLDLAAYSTVSVPGRVGQALAFNGANSYLSLNDQTITELTADLTLAAWIRTSNASRNEAVFSKYDAGGAESGYLLKTTPSGTLALRFGAVNVASGSREVTDATRINDGAWHHVAVVITVGRDVRFYVDGALSSAQTSYTIARKNGTVFQVGAQPGQYYGYPFTGTLDELRIYRAALSAADVLQLSGGSPQNDVVPPTISFTGPAPGQVLSGKVTLSATAADDLGVAGVQFTGDGALLGPELTAAPYTTIWDTTLVANGPHILGAVARDKAGNKTTASVSVSVANTVPAPPPAALAPSAYWTFDSTNISGNLALDKTATRLNLTMYNLVPVVGRLGQALSFNGVNGYLGAYDQSGVADLYGDLTLAAWIKTTATRAESLISKYDSGGNESGYVLKIASGKPVLRIGANNVLDGRPRDLTGSAVINDGNWHHVVAVITLGQNVRFYVDGVLNATQTAATVARKNGAPLEVGEFPGHYYALPFTGVMDDVRVYGKALAPADVAGVYSGI